MPWTRHIFPQATGWNTQKKITQEIQSLVRELVKEHKSTLDPNDNRDFMDVYLNEVETSQDADFNDEALIVTAMDLFGAGSETTATTLSWAVLYMILYPEVQAKIHQEIDEVIGTKEPSMEDKPNLPYTDACIMEIQRLGSIAGQAVPHRTLKECEIQGYKIPQNTIVFSILHHIMRDPDYWESPNTFKPERFLNSTQTQIIKEERLVPFGIGKRLCLGETLAKAELFIIITRLLQKFSFVKSPQHPSPTDEPVFGFILAPKPFHAIATPRTAKNC